MPERLPSLTNWRVTDHARRRVYTLVAAAASVIQLAIAVTDVVTSGGLLPLEPLVGALICATAAALLAFTRMHWQWIDYGVLAAATATVGAQVLHALQTPAPPPARLLFTGVFLFLAGFSILRARWAVVYAGVVFAAFAIVVDARGGDVTLLGHLGLCGLLIAHLSTYGRQLSVERAELAVVHRLALTDPLTGVQNRRAALQILHQAFTDTRPITILLVDIDHFKRVNDTFGHDTGDEVLRVVAVILKRTVGSSGHVARWGGEEFLVTLPGVPAISAGALAEQARRAVVAGTGDGVPAVTVSIGVACHTEGAAVPTMLQVADARLYAAKLAGRNRVEAGSTGIGFGPSPEAI